MRAEKIQVEWEAKGGEKMFIVYESISNQPIQ